MGGRPQALLVATRSAPPRSATSAELEEAEYYACALIHLIGARPDGLDESGARQMDVSGQLLARCRQLTRRVELVTVDGSPGALLALGRCAAAEARQVTAPLLAWLRRAGGTGSVGVGPGPAIAEMAALTALIPTAGDHDTSAVRLITPSQRAAWLDSTPGISIPLSAPFSCAALQTEGRSASELRSFHTTEHFPIHVKSLRGASCKGLRSSAVARSRAHRVPDCNGYSNGSSCVRIGGAFVVVCKV